MKPRSYHEVRLLSTETRPEVYQLSLYLQHPLRHLVGRWRARLDKVSWRIIFRLDVWLFHRHRASCNGCTWTLTTEGEREQLCGYLPLSIRHSLRVCEALERGRVPVARYEITKVEAVALGFPLIPDFPGVDPRQKDAIT